MDDDDTPPIKHLVLIWLIASAFVIAAASMLRVMLETMLS